MKLEHRTLNYTLGEGGEERTWWEVTGGGVGGAQVANEAKRGEGEGRW